MSRFEALAPYRTEFVTYVAPSRCMSHTDYLLPAHLLILVPYPLPNKRNESLRALLIIRIFIRELLGHELVFCAHPPEENAAENDEKKNPGAAALTPASRSTCRSS